MSPAHVIEPTYVAIKQRLMRGEWPAGTRLESARLADELYVSVTPVRDSLYRLAGEQMVDFAHGEGFHVHCYSETELRDMLELNLLLLLSALGLIREASPPPTERHYDHAERLAALFLCIAGQSGNAALAGTIGSLNDRLHLARRFDEQILGYTAAESARLEEALRTGEDPGRLRLAMMRHHVRRAKLAHVYARLMARDAR